MGLLQKPNNELVAEIHDAFYSAGDSALEEARNLLINPDLKKAAYAERLSKVGFAASKPVTDAVEMAEAHLKAHETIRNIEYFKVYYPNNKFITEAQVKKICEKYGLLLGDAGNYIGDVPEKNLAEIENFKLRKEDWTEKVLAYGFQSFWFDMGIWSTRAEGITSVKSRRTGVLSEYYKRVNAGIGLIPSLGLMSTQPEPELKPEVQYGWRSGLDPHVKDQPKKETEQAAFKICAPQKDFNTAGFTVKDGHILVYDPIVLQPVREGFLIVTAWGQEASDEIVVNEAQN